MNFAARAGNQVRRRQIGKVSRWSGLAPGKRGKKAATNLWAKKPSLPVVLFGGLPCSCPHLHRSRSPVIADVARVRAQDHQAGHRYCFASNSSA
jgi:hypothetical protein